MTREDKIKAIYEKIADKTLSFWCKIRNKDLFCWNNKSLYYISTRYDWIITTTMNECLDHITWHPVMIWDVLDYITNIEEETLILKYDINRYWNEWNKWIVEEIYVIWNNLRKPIEEQSEECINYIYNLIK